MSSFRHYVTEERSSAGVKGTDRHGNGWLNLQRSSHLLPHILHPWPSERFAVKYQRWEPGA
jgi:hypothetical protein